MGPFKPLKRIFHQGRSKRSVDDVSDTPRFSGRFLLVVHVFRDVSAECVGHDGVREGFESCKKARAGH